MSPASSSTTPLALEAHWPFKNFLQHFPAMGTLQMFPLWGGLFSLVLVQLTQILLFFLEVFILSIYVLREAS